MVVYIVTREENGRTAMWPPFRAASKAIGLIDSHVNFRVKNGAKVQRKVCNSPGEVLPGTKVRVGGSEGQPVLIDAPECINCVIQETELILENGNGRSTYKVTQAAIQE